MIAKRASGDGAGYYVCMKPIRTILATAIAVSLPLVAVPAHAEGPDKAERKAADPAPEKLPPVLPTPSKPAPPPPHGGERPVPGPYVEPIDDVAAAAKLATASNAFALDLWKTQRATRGNLAMSPTSLTGALAMTWGGAKGKTETQMRKALHLQDSTNLVAAGWRNLSRGLQDPSRRLKLRIVNRLFGEQSFEFERSFLNLSDAGFGAPLEKVDFVTSAEAQRTHINDWVSKQTESRIKDLLASNTIDSNTKLVLVNAIYFLADWASPFAREQTRDESFIVDKTTTKNVATMHQRGTLRMTKSGKASVLELPYQGDDTAMWIVLPDAANGLAAVEAGLSAKQIASWNANFKPEQISVSLPKFEVNPTASLMLNEPLKKLGIKDAFDQKKANFEGMNKSTNPNQRLFIAAVVHKAFVKVDEKGTEAAAATAVVMASRGAMPMPATKFQADHPFLFLIVDKKTGLVLFMGRVVDPSQK